jgi:hypothetical protein
VEDVIRNFELEPVRLRYGDYHRDDYRRELDRAAIAVFLSSFETQGIALAEAWAMNVPTLVWNPKSEASWRGRSFIAGSSAPYLTVATGLPWVSLDELSAAMAQALSGLQEFTPRQWVLENMTDEICSERLMRIIETESQTRHRSPLR